MSFITIIIIFLNRTFVPFVVYNLQILSDLKYIVNIRLVHNSIAIMFHMLVVQYLWDYLSIVIFYLKFNCCA